jgi:choline dehydrogenase-like flavoprotein
VTITKARSHVVIVGAGPSAAVAALRLLRAGLDVTCFEQGDWPDRASFGGDTPAGELIGLKQWSSRPAIRSGPADYPIDDATSDMKALNYNGVGGGSVLYNAQWPRMVPGDFRVRSSDGVGADWPLTYAELQPFYDATDRQSPDSAGIRPIQRATSRHCRRCRSARWALPSLAPTATWDGTGGPKPTRSCQRHGKDVARACSAAPAGAAATKARKPRQM